MSASQRAFSHLAGSRISPFTLMGSADQPISTAGAWVTSEFFDVFAMTPLAGRVFSTTTDAAATDAPVVISEKTWREAFGGSAAILGQRIKIDGTLHTVIGVMPQAFRWPDEAELWLLSPRPVPPAPVPVEETDRRVRYFQWTGRLAPTVTFAMAQQLGLPLMNICSTCQGIESMVQAKLSKDPEYLDKVNAILADEGLTYTPGLEIKNFLWVLVEDLGLDKLKSMVKRPLTGLHVGPFYGCYILRPSQILGFDDHNDRDKYLEWVIEAVGAHVVDYEGIYRLCYIRGPGGLLIGLAQEL